MGLKIVLILLIVHGCFAFAKTPCNTTDLESGCGEHQTCMQVSESSTLGFCECERGFEKATETQCMNRTSSPSTANMTGNDSPPGHTAAIVVSFFFIAFVICAAYVGYRYKVHTWIRSKLNQRNRSYNEFIIGQDLDDDPPLE